MEWKHVIFFFRIRMVFDLCQRNEIVCNMFWTIFGSIELNVENKSLPNIATKKKRLGKQWAVVVKSRKRNNRNGV